MDIIIKITHFTVISLNPVRRWPGVTCLQAGSGPSPLLPSPPPMAVQQDEGCPKMSGRLRSRCPPQLFLHESFWP